MPTTNETTPAAGSAVDAAGDEGPNPTLAKKEEFDMTIPTTRAAWEHVSAPSTEVARELRCVPSADILGELARRYARVVGGHVRWVIEQSGRSLSAVAIAADISPDLLAAYLRGERPWLVDDLMLVADVLGVDVMDLLAAGER